MGTHINASANYVDHEKYLNLTTEWSRWLLKPMGLWPVPSSAPMIERSFYLLIKVVCYGLQSFVVLFGFLYFAMEPDDFHMKLKFCGPLGFCAMGLMKYHSLIAHGKDIRECVDRIEWDWKNVRHDEDRDIMIVNANFGRKLVSICSFFMYSGAAFYYIIVPSMHGVVVDREKNLTYIPDAFPVPKKLIESRHHPANEIIFVIQLLVGIMMHGIGAAVCSVAATFAVHANGQMEILMCWLKHLINRRKDMSESVDVRVAEIVKQHMRVTEFLTITEDIMRQISLIEFAGCSSNMCLLGYYIIVEAERNGMAATLTYCLILTSIIFDVFIYCYIGELVAEQWTMIGEMSYMSDWYQISGKRKLSFVLIIAMSNTSKKLTAGNVMELSLETFTSVMKTTFAFFNMLRTLT